LPLPAPAAGQGLWLHFGVIGFGRDDAGHQPNVAIAFRVLDQDGKPTLAQPVSGAINNAVPDKDVVLTVQLSLLLNRPGKFTLELTAPDRLSGKKDTVSFPLTVMANP